MTVFTGWTGWLIFITALIAAWLLCATAIAATWHLAKCAYLRRLGIHVGAPRDDLYSYGDRLIRTLNQEAERLYPDGDDNQAWPPDLCHFPPCGWEDNWVCAGHRQTDCSCTTYTDQETGRAVWITCSTCRPAGRHHRRADIVTATLDQLDEWRRAQ